MSNPFKVAVVGGGIAGLIAAIELARGGARVTLFERAERLGGRALSRERDGFVFNQGPHALYNDGAFRWALADYGVAFAGAPPQFDEAAAMWGDALHPLPRNLTTILAAAPLSFAERGRLLSLFVSLPRLDLARWRGRPLCDFTQPLPHRVRAVFHALARLSTYAQAPDRLDAAAALAQMRLASAGVTYVDGGWSVLVEGLRRRAQDAGAEIRLGAPAETIESCDGRWRVGAEGLADAVILATPPEVAALLLPGSKALAAATRAAIPVRALALDYALRRLPRPRACFALGIDAPLYFSVHSASARLAPEGGALVHAARYLAPDEAADAEATGTVKALVERLQPGFEAEIVHSARLLGMPVAFDMPCAARSGRMARIAIDDAPGVFLAGDWVGEGAMLSDAAAKSARESATAALGFAHGLAAA